MDHLIRLVLHGGAGITPGVDYSRCTAHLAALGTRCEQALRGGGTALDVVESAVADMEASGLYVAGRGSQPNRDGEVEMDAAIMDGATRQAGAVAGVRTVRSPVGLARRVMRDSPHVLLVGTGAEDFARAVGVALIADPATHFVTPPGLAPAEPPHGTVGAVARDRQGRLAAATSTGGTLDKLAGRVGDSPLIGAGTWADESVAVSCTGVGEYFIRTAAAHEVAARVRLAGEPLAQAVETVLAAVAALGGTGGIIAVSARGEKVARWTGSGMKHYLRGAGRCRQ